MKHWWILGLVVVMMLQACTGVTSILQNPDTDTATQPDHWEPIVDGLAQRRLQIEGTASIFQAVRIDPQQYIFRVHYRAGAPLTISEWQQALPDAAIIVNANFFSPEYTVLGLLISDGVRFGETYRGRGGTFAVQDDVPRVYSTIAEPYRGEAFTQAVQAFPMLVQDGQAAFNNEAQRQPSRRTVIAQDASGQIILMVTSGFGPSLYDLSQWLPTAEPSIINAFNLDGGGSSMLHIAATDLTIRSIDPVPAVLAAYRRSADASTD